MSPLHEAFRDQHFRKKGHELIDQIADYFETIQSAESNSKVLLWRPPEEAYEDWKNFLSQDQSASDFFQKVMAHSIHIHHPNYMGHQVGPPLPDSVLNGIMVNALKNGSGLYEMSPLAAPMEKIIMEFFAKHIGYDEKASGFLTSGGTLANLTALLTARQIKGHGDIWNEGNSKEKQLAIMVSEEAHYGVTRAVQIMGLGTSGVVKIPTNDKFQVDVNRLEETYNNALAEGKTVFAIVGNACSTSVGAYDDLEAIGTFAQKNNLWFHVDGAHGGVAIFSKKYQHLVKGIALADSIIIDGHKMMMTAGLTTAVIYRDGKNSYRTFHQKAYYLWENTGEEWFNLTKRTFECTKFTDALEFYSLIKNHGAAVFGELVNCTYDLAKSFAERLEVHPNFEIAHRPEANILCFRLFKKGENEKEQNELNAKIRKRLTHQGDFYIVQTMIRNSVYLRVSLMNPFTTIEILEKLMIELLKLVKESQPDFFQKTN